MRIVDHLSQCFRGHRTSPDHGLIGIREETDGHDFNSVGFYRAHFRFAVHVHRHGFCMLHVEHQWSGRSVDIGINQSYFKAHLA